MSHSTALTMWNGRGGYFLLGMGIRLLRLGRRLDMVGVVVGDVVGGDTTIRRGGDILLCLGRVGVVVGVMVGDDSTICRGGDILLSNGFVTLVLVLVSSVFGVVGVEGMGDDDVWGVLEGCSGGRDGITLGGEGVGDTDGGDPVGGVILIGTLGSVGVGGGDDGDVAVGGRLVGTLGSGGVGDDELFFLWA